jgi:hypothetical protein
LEVGWRKHFPPPAGPPSGDHLGGDGAADNFEVYDFVTQRSTSSRFIE